MSKERSAHDRKTAAAAHDAERAWHGDGVAVSGSYASTVAGGREAGAPVPGFLCAERNGHGILDAEGRRRRVRTGSHHAAARPLPGQDARILGYQGKLELYPRGRV